jgi:hypothetical protein
MSAVLEDSAPDVESAALSKAAPKTVLSHNNIPSHTSGTVLGVIVAAGVLALANVNSSSDGTAASMFLFAAYSIIVFVLLLVVGQIVTSGMVEKIGTGAGPGWRRQSGRTVYSTAALTVLLLGTMGQVWALTTDKTRGSTPYIYVYIFSIAGFYLGAFVHAKWSIEPMTDTLVNINNGITYASFVHGAMLALVVITATAHNRYVNTPHTDMGEKEYTFIFYFMVGLAVLAVLRFVIMKGAGMDDITRKYEVTASLPGVYPAVSDGIKGNLSLIGALLLEIVVSSVSVGLAFLTLVILYYSVQLRNRTGGPSNNDALFRGWIAIAIDGILVVLSILLARYYDHIGSRDDQKKTGSQRFTALRRVALLARNKYIQEAVMVAGIAGVAIIVFALESTDSLSSLDTIRISTGIGTGLIGLVALSMMGAIISSDYVSRSNKVSLLPGVTTYAVVYAALTVGFGLIALLPVTVIGFHYQTNDARWYADLFPTAVAGGVMVFVMITYMVRYQKRHTYGGVPYTRGSGELFSMAKTSTMSRALANAGLSPDTITMHGLGLGTGLLLALGGAATELDVRNRTWPFTIWAIVMATSIAVHSILVIAQIYQFTERVRDGGKMRTRLYLAGLVLLGGLVTAVTFMFYARRPSHSEFGNQLWGLSAGLVAAAGAFLYIGHCLWWEAWRAYDSGAVSHIIPFYAYLGVLGLGQLLASIVVLVLTAVAASDEWRGVTVAAIVGAAVYIGTTLPNARFVGVGIMVGDK